MTKLPEISSLLFSVSEAIEKLNLILSDSIILRMDFSVEAVGRDLETILNFSSDDLRGQSLGSITEPPGLIDQLKERLKFGYFDNVHGTFLSRRGGQVEAIFSGFYLGLISDINGFIVLKIKVVDNVSCRKKEMVSKKNEIDSFIYRTAHDLRGPLATIKGLVNLLKIRKDDFEVDELTSLIEIHANKLDDRLFKLIYLAEGDEEQSSEQQIRFAELEEVLRKVLVDNCQLDKAKFEFNAPAGELTGVDEQRLYQLLGSILMYIVSLPISSPVIEERVKIALDFVVSSKWIEIRIVALGFIASQKVQSLVRKSASLYNDVLVNPYLFNYYVSQKRAMQMGALLKIDFHSSINQEIKIVIRRRVESQVTGRSTKVNGAMQLSN